MPRSYSECELLPCTKVTIWCGRLRAVVAAVLPWMIYVVQRSTAGMLASLPIERYLGYMGADGIEMLVCAFYTQCYSLLLIGPAIRRWP